MLLDPKDAEASLRAAGQNLIKGSVYEVNPGLYGGFYDIVDVNGLALGVLMEMGANSVQSGGYTWPANQSLWFWSTPQFPNAFRLKLRGYNIYPASNPASASPKLTAGPFVTTGTVAPASGGQWWTIQLLNNGVYTGLGWLNIQPNGVQNWYEFSANAYMTISGTQQLVFTHQATGPTTAMYRYIANPVA